ncbi:MAG: glycosyltransferase [Nitrososphaerales archaeon]
MLGNYPYADRSRGSVDLRKSLGIPTDRRILIYQGGFYTAARSFGCVAEALRLLPQWHWVLIGFGSPRALAELHAIVVKAGIGDRVNVLPPVAVAELAGFTRGADVGVVPLLPTHLANYLGDTNKLFEYLQAGLPVVASDFPVFRQVLCADPDGPIGSVFDPVDPQSVVDSIRSLEDRIDELGNRAEKVGVSRYCWQVEQAKLIDLYDKLRAQSADAR